MVTVTLGKTGITVNKNGFGALPIQRISKEEAAGLLRKTASILSTRPVPTPTAKRRSAMLFKGSGKSSSSPPKRQPRMRMISGMTYIPV